MVRTGLLAWLFCSVPVSVLIGRMIAAGPTVAHVQPNPMPEMVWAPGTGRH